MRAHSESRVLLHNIQRTPTRILATRCCVERINHSASSCVHQVRTHADAGLDSIVCLVCRACKNTRLRLTRHGLTTTRAGSPLYWANTPATVFEAVSAINLVSLDGCVHGYITRQPYLDGPNAPALRFVEMLLSAVRSVAPLQHQRLCTAHALLPLQRCSISVIART